jgi:heptosyltransferase-2
VHKILVIRLSSLGDVILTLPVLHALRQAYPAAKIVLLVKEAFADAVANHPDGIEIMTLKRGESLKSLAARVRAEAFDGVIDLHGNLRSRAVSLASGARRRVRYRKAALARRLYVGFRVAGSSLRKHTLDRYMETLRRLDPRQPAFQRPAAPAGEKSKILVIQTAFLGDAVLTTPLLGALQEKLPQAQVTVLCTPETEDVFRRHPGVQSVLVYNKRSSKGDRSTWKLASRLRRENFDLAILPHRSFRSAMAAWLAGIPRRIGFSTSQGRFLLTDVVPFQWGVHDVDRNLRLLEALGVGTAEARLEMHADPAAVAAMRSRLAAAGVPSDARIIGVHAGSVWATKRWLPEGFAAVADRLLAEERTAVIFVGGAKDRAATEALMTLMRQRPLNWVGETDLKQLVATVSLCSAFLTNDSGPMHIAVACGVPTVALFGPTTKELGFFPYGPGHTVIEKELPCRPCGLHGARACPLGHFQCMRLITPDEVYQAVKAAMTTTIPRKAATR